LFETFQIIRKMKQQIVIPANGKILRDGDYNGYIWINHNATILIATNVINKFNPFRVAVQL